MAKLPIRKKNKPKVVVVAPLPIHPPTLLRGAHPCGVDTVHMAVRIPHHPKIECQMLTVRCPTCGATYYLTERGE